MLCQFKRQTLLILYLFAFNEDRLFIFSNAYTRTTLCTAVQYTAKKIVVRVFEKFTDISNIFIPGFHPQRRATVIRSEVRGRGRWSREAKPIFHEPRSRRSLFLFLSSSPSRPSKGASFHDPPSTGNDAGRRGREEILRSERNGVPVMGSPRISLKCRGLSIIRGQPLLHRASRSAGDQVRKERKEGGDDGRGPGSQTAKRARSFLLSFFLSFC